MPKVTTSIVLVLFWGLFWFTLGTYVPWHINKPKFGDFDIVIDNSTNYAVLILDREWYGNLSGRPGWQYTVALVRENGVKAIDWKREDELRLPTGNNNPRLELAQRLGECTLYMNSSSPDRNLEECYNIHIADRGYWSFPIKDGKVDIQVEQVHLDVR